MFMLGYLLQPLLSTLVAMIHSTLTIALLGVGLLSRSALAHSWVRCTDYRVENPGQPEPLGRGARAELRWHESFLAQRRKLLNFLRGVH